MGISSCRDLVIDSNALFAFHEECSVLVLISMMPNKGFQSDEAIWEEEEGLKHDQGRLD